MKGFEEFDFSDNSKLGSKDRAVAAECKVGRYIMKFDKSGKSRLHELSDKEIAKLDAENLDPTPCVCQVCTKRRDFMGEVTAARGSTRSGNKRGFWKYGEGHRLDEADK